MEPMQLPLTGQLPQAEAIGSSSRKANPALLESQKIQSAKDFESLFVGKLVDSMKETVGNSGLLDDEGSEQMQSMFWMHLSGAISQQGGLGMWKDIHRSIYGTAPAEQRGELPGNGKTFDRTI
jgi:Rod binding domain-containing protein